MKITIGQTKSGILMVFEDDSSDPVRVLNLNYREAAGLYHELKEALENPAWENRDPQAKDPEIRNQKQIVQMPSKEELQSARIWKQENFPGIKD